MSMQQQSDVYNHLSNQPSIVGSKHNSAMQCAIRNVLRSCSISARERSSYSNWNRLLTISSGQTRAHLR